MTGIAGQIVIPGRISEKFRRTDLRGYWLQCMRKSKADSINKAS